jgi:hypothetical protein
MCPSELKKLAPEMEMLCPAAPLDGVMESMTGGPPGVAASVVDVVVLEAAPDGVGWWTGRWPPVPALGTVDADGAATGVPPSLRETIRATASTTTARAATATATTNQRSDRPAHRAANESRLIGAGGR